MGHRTNRPIVHAAALLVAATAIWLMAASAALAAWSTPRLLRGPVPSYLVLNGPAASATDARGDVALIWRVDKQAGRAPHWWYDASVLVAFAGPSGPLVSHTIWRHSHSYIASVTVALDAHGELTVAWIEEPSQSRGPITVRARHRSPAVRWSATQTVGYSSTAFSYANPELAVAPNREVLLTWNAGSSVGMRAAWRTPGHGFGPPTRVTHSRQTAIVDPTPVIDSSGAAHIYGTIACGSSTSRGVMLSTAPHGHRFHAPVIVAPAPAENLLVSFAARGQALAAWERAPCSTLEPGPGSPYARVIHKGVFTPPVALDSGTSTSRAVPVANESGGGSIAWMGWSFTSAPTASLLMAGVDASGQLSPPAGPANSLAPVARDATGDLILQDRIEEPYGPIPPHGSSLASPVAVQPAAGGAPDPSPLRPFVGTALELSRSTFATAVSAVGPGVALIWRDDKAGKLAVAIWRP